MSDKPPLVLLHGWGVSHCSWQVLLPELEKAYQVLTLVIDYEQNESTRLASLAEQMPDNSLVCGWSLGGMLATRLAFYYPKKVSALITLATNLVFIKQAAWSNAMSQTAFKNFQNSFDQQTEFTKKRFIAIQVQGDEKAREQRSYLQQYQDKSPKKKLLQGLDLLAGLDNRKLLPVLSCPAWHYLGQYDALVPQSVKSCLESIVSKAQQIHTVEGAGHVLHYPPQRFMKILSSVVAGMGGQL